MPAEDEFRESEQQQQEDDQVDQIPNPNSEAEIEQPSWKKTKGRGLFQADNGDVSHYDKETKDALTAQAATAKQRGIDKPKSNPDVGKFPLPIKKATIDSPLGDWSLNVPSIYGPYPNMDAKSGFTNPEIYPSDVSKKNIDYDNLKENGKSISEKLEKRRQDYNKYKDYASKQFTHLLDYFSAQRGLGDPKPGYTGTFENGEVQYVDTKNIYLGSFIKTFDDNEDPTMLGYDIIIKWDDSPLFNGTIDTFISRMADLGNSEIASRASILNRFKAQLVRFLRADLEETSVLPKFDKDNPGVKTYYLRKIQGLNNLMNTFDGNEGKQFADYGKDFITLGFNEDVTQNIGYLAATYNALTYSRLNGRQLIPENLLRFDVDIEITEIRKYNRVFKEENNKMGVYADTIAKYTYTLFECQFFFSSMPHGDMLDLSAPALVDEYSIKFNYKWSFMKFTRFAWYKDFTSNVAGQTGSVPTGETWKTIEDPLDNRNTNPIETKSNSTNNNFVSGSGDSAGQIISGPATKNPELMSTVDETGKVISPPLEREGELEAVKRADKISKVAEATPTSLISNTTNSEVAPVIGGPGNIKELISKSSIQKALDTAQLPTPSSIKEEVLSRFGEVSSVISNASFKGFNLGILGGQIQKATGGIGSLQGAIGGLMKGNILGRLNDVKLASISPSLKGFNLGVLGGQISKSAGGLLGNLGGIKSNILGRLNEVKSSAIAPFAKGFNLNILGGEIAKSAGGLLGNLGGIKSNILGRLNDVKLASIAPSLKGFNLGMLGGKLTDAVGSIAKSSASAAKGLVKDNFEKLKQKVIETGTKKINNTLVSQASLLNKTLSNITQVKIPGNSVTKQLQTKATEQVQKFVGKSVKSFFSRK